jgi:hypothetical protein
MAKSAVAYAVAQEVLRFSRTINVQMRVATGDTVVSGIHIPEGTPVWLCPQQVCTPFSLVGLLDVHVQPPAYISCYHLTKVVLTYDTKQNRPCP